MKKVIQVAIDIEKAKQIAAKGTLQRKTLLDLIPDLFEDNTIFCNVGAVLFHKEQTKKGPLMVCLDKYKSELFLIALNGGYTWKTRVPYKNKAFNGVTVSQIDALFVGQSDHNKWVPSDNAVGQRFKGIRNKP